MITPIKAKLRYTEGYTTKEDEKFLRELAKAIEGGTVYSSNISPLHIVGAGLTGIAAIVSMEGCTTIQVPQIVYPVGAPQIKSDWQDQYNVLGQWRGYRHPGIDIVAPRGSHVLTSADGDVEFAEFYNIGGNVVRLFHGQDKKGRYLFTEYAHLDDMIVKKGQKVKRGEVVGTLGMTGDVRTIPHLHFNLIVRAERDKQGWREDPKSYFPRINIGTKDEKILILCYKPGESYKSDDILFTYPVECKR